MPGMNSGLDPADPVIVAAFRSALLHQLAIVGIIFLLLLLAWGATRGWVTVGSKAAQAPAAACASRGRGPCCGLASGSCGSSTASSRPSRKWPRACPRR